MNKRDLATLCRTIGQLDVMIDGMVTTNVIDIHHNTYRLVDKAKILELDKRLNGLVQRFESLKNDLQVIRKELRSQREIALTEE